VRLESQAPEIDPVVYLTECDPATIAPGSFLEAEIVGGRGYDLLARPLQAAGPNGPGNTGAAAPGALSADSGA
jgi:hypothetical protein